MHKGGIFFIKYSKVKFFFDEIVKEKTDLFGIISNVTKVKSELIMLSTGITYLCFFYSLTV